MLSSDTHLAVVQVITHDGGLPGFSTLVTFLPFDGIAVVVLVNADNKEEATLAITLQVFESLLGLKGPATLLAR